MKNYFLKYIEFDKTVRSFTREERTEKGYLVTKRTKKRVKTDKKYRGIVVGFTSAFEGSIDMDWDDGSVYRTFKTGKSYQVLQVKTGISNKIIQVDPRDVKIIKKFKLPTKTEAVYCRRDVEYLGMEGVN